MARRLPPPAEVVEDALARSRSDACVVIVHEGSEVEARFANNTSTTNGARRERRVAVVSIRMRGGRAAVGVASRGGDPDLGDLVRSSEADADSAVPAEDAMALLGPGEGAPEPPAAEAFSAPARGTDQSVLGGVLAGLVEVLDAARAAGHVVAGFASHRLETVYLGTSTGTRLRHEQPTGSLELVARAADGGRSAWVGRGTPWFEDVDLPAMHRELVQRLSWAERRVDLPAGRYETILPPDATADLVVPLVDSLSGRDAEDGRNAFSAAGGGTKVGERLFALPFALRSDPGAPGLECAPFLATAASGTDVSVLDNGMALAPTAWVESGALRRLRYDRAGAARSGHPVAPPIDNVTLDLPGAHATLADLVAGTRRALLVTCLWYIREVDPVTMLLTGLTRDGVYLIEDGEVVAAVNNFRFNESPLGVLGRVVEAGRAERSLSRESGEWMNRTATPALRVADFNMSSVSAAT